MARPGVIKMILGLPHGNAGDKVDSFNEGS